MKIDDKIRDEILQYNINREAAKTSALSSGKMNEYEYFSDLSDVLLQSIFKLNDDEKLSTSITISESQLVIMEKWQWKSSEVTSPKRR